LKHHFRHRCRNTTLSKDLPAGGHRSSIGTLRRQTERSHFQQPIEVWEAGRSSPVSGGCTPHQSCPPSHSGRRLSSHSLNSTSASSCFPVSEAVIATAAAAARMSTTPEQWEQTSRHAPAVSHHLKRGRWSPKRKEEGKDEDTLIHVVQTPRARPRSAVVHSYTAEPKQRRIASLGHAQMQSEVPPRFSKSALKSRINEISSLLATANEQHRQLLVLLATEAEERQ